MGGGGRTGRAPGAGSLALNLRDATPGVASMDH